MIFSVRRSQYYISHSKSQRLFVTRHRLSCEKVNLHNKRVTWAWDPLWFSQVTVLVSFRFVDYQLFHFVSFRFVSSNAISPFSVVFFFFLLSPHQLFASTQFLSSNNVKSLRIFKWLELCQSLLWLLQDMILFHPS